MQTHLIMCYSSETGTDTPASTKWVYISDETGVDDNRNYCVLRNSLEVDPCPFFSPCDLSGKLRMCSPLREHLLRSDLVFRLQTYKLDNRLWLLCEDTAYYRNGRYQCHIDLDQGVHRSCHG